MTKNIDGYNGNISKNNTHQNFRILLLALIFLYSIMSVHALRDEDLVWNEGNVYTLTPEDNMVTEKEYTIKLVELPSPVRGITMMNGTRPEKNVTLYAALELYKDIANNKDPIEKFVLGLDDYHISSDKELKITLDSMPKENSQSWVYEYYNPSASIKIQKRSLPKIDVRFKLKNINESVIDPGDEFDIEVRIKNIGDDSALDVNYNIDIGSLKLIANNQSLKDSIYILNKDETRTILLTLGVPISIDEKEYIIYANVASHDIKDAMYNWNFSKNITSRNIIRSILVNKSTKNTYYMKENVSVLLDIANTGPLDIDNIKLYDYIPYGSNLIFVKGDIDKGGFKDNSTEFLTNKTILRSGESWTVTYLLTPREPGVYLLPKFRMDFSIRGRNFNLTSNEKGFRIFGPKLILNKSVMNRGNDILDIKIKAKNIGNGFAARVHIEDKLPENAVLLNGKTDYATSLYADEEKIMNYTVKMSSFKGINLTAWPPAIATYWLDDYKFTTSSDEKVIEEIMPQDTAVAKPKVTVPVPTENKSAKRVVATISKTPLVKEKETPGFKFYELLVVLISVLVLIKKTRKIN